MRLPLIFLALHVFALLVTSTVSASARADTSIQAYECRSHRVRYENVPPPTSAFSACENCVRLHLLLQNCRVLSWFGRTGGLPENPELSQISPIENATQIRSPNPPHSISTYAEKTFRIQSNAPGGTSPSVIETMSFPCPQAIDTNANSGMSAIHLVLPRLNPPSETRVGEYYLNCSRLPEHTRDAVLHRYRNAAAARGADSAAHEVDWSLLRGADIVNQAPSDTAPVMRLQEELRVLLERNQIQSSVKSREVSAVAAASGAALFLSQFAIGRWTRPFKAAGAGLGALGLASAPSPSQAEAATVFQGDVLFQHFRSENGQREFVELSPETAAGILERSPRLRLFLEARVRLSQPN